MVKAGRLEAERVERPQGHVWLVKVPSPAVGQVTSRHDLGAVADGHAAGPPALAAWMTSVLEPLVAELRLSRERIETLAGERAQFRAELEAARATIATLTGPESPLLASTAAAAPDPTTGAPWSRWRTPPAWVLMLLAIVAVVVLLGWPR